MKYNNLILRVVLFVCCIAMVSCSEDQEYVQSGNEQNYFKINISDAGIYSNSPSKATTDGNYVTTFEEGDQVGLFGVKDGVVLSNLQNLTVTYNGSNWDFPGGEKIELEREESEGAVFYAYYPYSEDVIFDPSKSDPFEELVNNWKIGADLQNDNYGKYDLMTASTTAIVREGDYALDFLLDHRMALAVIDLPAITYTFTNSTPIPVYSIGVANETFTVAKGGNAAEAVKPYYDPETGLYRILLLPSTDYTINGEFAKNNKKNGYQLDIDGLSSGKYVLYTVDGGSQKISHELKVGDLYYADGSIVSVDEENPDPTDCIGVVYHLGNAQPSSLYSETYTTEQDVLLREYPDCVRAMVIGLKESVDQFTDVLQEIRAWYINEPTLGSTYIDLAGNLWENGATSNTASAARDQVLGYNNTELIKMYAAQNPGNWMFIDHLNAYEDVAPSVTTGWYLPSAGEYEIYTYLSRDIMTSRAAMDLVNAQITKVSGVTLVDGNYYWTSTERNNQNMYYMSLGFSASTGNIVVAATGGRKYQAGFEARYRFFLMF